MSASSDQAKILASWPEIVRRVRERTPARLLNGRCGAAYPTETQMELRQAHAAARDAVRAELEPHSIIDKEFLRRWKLFEVSTRARSKEEYLLRPDLGRRFDDSSRREILARCRPGSDFQVALGDGLSVTALVAQAPALLSLLFELAPTRGWTVGQAFLIRHCRVGVLNEIGALLSARVAVLLIGERPGLASAESLSAYMAHRPNLSQTDADRNLVSNIHSRGLGLRQAADRILALADAMMKAQLSGSNLKLAAQRPNPG